MEPLAVDLLLLRALLTPEIKIVPGRAVMARVVTTAGQNAGKGALSIAGTVIDAELPKSVKAGQDIRLVVKEVTAERVVLTLANQPPPVAPPPPAVPLPGGGKIRLTEREESDQGGSGSSADGRHTLSVRYDAPTLGAVDLRLDLEPGSLKVAIELPQGQQATLAEQAADDLQRELAADSERAATVTVIPRREPLDLYA
jgi:hypothetical protein